MEYENLDLEARDYTKVDGAERWRVYIPKGPRCAQDLDEAEWVQLPAGLRDELRRLEKRELTRSELISLGTELGRLLFPPKLQMLLHSELKAVSPNRLRIRLKLKDYPVADLPWEFAYVPDPFEPGAQHHRKNFMALNRKFSLVRYEMRTGVPNPVRRHPTPLRIAVLLADPAQPPYDRLDLDEERTRMESDLGGRDEVQVDFWPQSEPYCKARLEDYEEALDTEPDVLHFAGHGEFEQDLGATLWSKAGKGFLVLMDEQRQRPRKYRVADKLDLELVHSTVRLVVLGACNTGRRGTQNAWTGIAPALMEVGVPMVVGMQFKILNTNAMSFCLGFYRTLARSKTVDEAVTEGRLRIVNRSDDNERDWGVPVLYLRRHEERGEEQNVVFRVTPHVGSEQDYQPGLTRRPAGMGFSAHVAGGERPRHAQPPTTDLTCPVCSARIPQRFQFCDHCNAALKYCTYCGTVNLDSVRFCRKCGTGFGA